MTNHFNLKPKQIANKRRHDFLLTFFDSSPHYATKEINGYLLVKQFNKTSDRWEVAIYTKENWKKKQDYQKTFRQGG